MPIFVTLVFFRFSFQVCKRLTVPNVVAGLAALSSDSHGEKTQVSPVVHIRLLWKSLAGDQCYKGAQGVIFLMFLLAGIPVCAVFNAFKG